jgi:hypothetical protein
MSLYPTVIRTLDTGYEMTFVDGDTVADLLGDASATQSPAELIGAAVEALFDAALRFAADPRVAVRNTFLGDQVTERWARTQLSLRPSSRAQSDGTRTELGRLRKQVLDDDSWLAKIVASGVGAKLSIAAHGDFVPTNIIRGSSVHFIDVRAVWLNTMPQWDPIMDLASFCVFVERIWPALRFAGLSVPISRDFGAGEVLEYALQSPAATKWISRDATWKYRFAAYSALRALGNLANHLTTTRLHGLERAVALYPTYRQLSSSVSVTADGSWPFGTE